MVNTRPYIWDLREWNGVVVNTRLVLNSFFWSSPTLIVFRLLGMVSAYVFFCVCLDSCVCSWWAEIKMRVDFFFFFPCGPMGIWRVDMFIPRDSCRQCFLATFLVIGVSPNENWDRVWVLYVYVDCGLSLP